MSQVLYGPRLGKEGELRLGCSAVIFDDSRQKVLLTQRADNGHWCLPGGHMESGESAAEACEREVFEETGLKVRATRLLGVYSNPDQLVIYKDGNKAFFVVLNFEVEVLEGTPGLSDETTAFGWFTLAEMETLPIHANHKSRVEDAMRGGDAVMK
ncbi:MAG: NUDIX domain-containing protein [Anaerolineales bacterium]